MKVELQAIEGLLLLRPDVHRDLRGDFYRGFCAREAALAGFDLDLKQTNISVNRKKHTLRGFHYQRPPTSESKVVTCVSGALFNVSIDLRPKSKTYLSHVSIELEADEGGSIIVPAGCANAFLTLQDNCVVYYLMGAFFNDDTYGGFRFDDPFFDINWPFEPVVISARDKEFPDFSETKMLSGEY